MPTLAPPPPPPRTATAEHDDARRYRMRMTQVMTTLITVLATAYLCTLGPIIAIIALATAKHVLVAVLVMGLGVDADRERPGGEESGPTG